MGWNPETHQFDRNMGEAPPNYAQIAPNIKNMELASKTNTRMGPDGVMHDYQYNPQTREFDIDMGTKPTGTAAQQTFQGEAIQQAGKKVIEDINAHKEILGNLSSYATQYLNGTPISDPNAATILADLKSFASMQPAMHAFRSTTAAQAFAKIVGGLANDPDSTIATINSLSGMAGIISGLGTGGGQNGSSYPKPGAKPVGQILDPMEILK